MTAEALALVDSGWRVCAGCGEEWNVVDSQGLCPDCAQEAARRQRAEALLQWRLEHREEVLTSVEIPNRLHRSVPELTWPRDPRALGSALQDWRGQPWCVTILGEPGVGKSTLATELAYRWGCAEASHTDGLWRRATTLLGEILKGRPEAHRARTCGLLILDDFGTGLGSPKAWATLGEVLAERHEWERPTIVTTNLDHPGLEAGHCPTADRLLDGLVCRLGGSSLRGETR